MSDIVERAMALWSSDLDDADEAKARFAEVYTDPVLVNGTPMNLPVLVARAQSMRTALKDLHHEVFDVVEGDGFVGFAFRIRGRFAGPYALARRSLEPTGNAVELQGMDIFHLDEDGRVAALWAVSDPSDLLPDAAV